MRSTRQSCAIIFAAFTTPSAVESYVYAFTILKTRFRTEFASIQFGNKGLVTFDTLPVLTAEAIGNIFTFVQQYRPELSDVLARRILSKVQMEQ